jgi:hypothetical protein
MTIVCSWCRGEGLAGIVGEKAPLDDRRETHGICTSHRLSEQARWHSPATGLNDARNRIGPDKEWPVGGHLTPLWIGLKNLARKTRR